MLSNYFDYTSEFPQQWENTLLNLAQRENRIITVRVPWGPHEAIRGNVDFVKSSKLKIEKIFQLAARQGSQIEIQLGFWGSKDCFPDWTLSKPNTSRVPAPLWDDSEEGFCGVEIPSIYEAEVLNSFREFVVKVMDLCQLYRSPQGPIQRLVLDLEVFSLDTGLCNQERFYDGFLEGLTSVEVINERFQTNFKTESSIRNKTAFRTLFEKRPWHASYEYKRSRNLLYEGIIKHFSDLRDLEIKNAGSDETSIQDNKFPAHSVAIDSVFLDQYQTMTLPFCPESTAGGVSSYAFRLAEYFQQHCLVSDARFFCLPQFVEQEKLVGSQFTTVVAGKYLTRVSANLIEKSAMSGGTLFFPFGFPQFDERMKILDWTGGADKRIHKKETFAFFNINRGLGRLIAPVQPLGISPDLWERILVSKETLLSEKT